MLQGLQANAQALAPVSFRQLMALTFRWCSKPLFAIWFFDGVIYESIVCLLYTSDAADE